MRPIVFLDTETTSLGPKREVWEVAMIRRDESEDQVEYSSFISISDLSKADPMSLKISRFYERHPDYGVNSGVAIPAWRVARTVHEWTRDAIIVGAVPNFDTEALDRLLRKWCLLPAWHYHLIDIENLALGYLVADGWDMRRWLDGGMKSDELSEACGVEPPGEEERHTALGDARWAMRWYDAITEPTK